MYSNPVQQACQINKYVWMLKLWTLFISILSPNCSRSKIEMKIPPKHQFFQFFFCLFVVAKPFRRNSVTKQVRLPSHLRRVFWDYLQNSANPRAIHARFAAWAAARATTQPRTIISFYISVPLRPLPIRDRKKNRWVLVYRLFSGSLVCFDLQVVGLSRQFQTIIALTGS